MNKDLHPTFAYQLKEAIGDETIVAFNVGPNGEVYILLAINKLDYRTKDNGFASFAKIIPASPQRYRVLVFREGELELDLAICDERFNIHEIQPLGNDLLLACSRSEYRGEHDFDLNGSHAFAVANEHALFAGGYGNPASFQLVRLASNGTSRLIGEFDLIGDDGIQVKPVQTIGRGTKLHVLGDAVLYEIDLKHVLATRDHR